MIGFNTDVGIVENFVENFVENGMINAMQAKIIELMKSDPKISAKKMSQAVGITSRSVQANIQTLKTLGFIKRVGPAKGGYWKVKVNDNGSISNGGAK